MSLFSELKRRNVFRVGAAYAILAWLLIQIIDTVLPTFDAPRWIIQTVTFLIILGFPLALFLAWAFELTPEGLKSDAAARTEKSPAAGDSFARVKSNTLNVIIMGLLLLAVGFLLVDRFVISNLSKEVSTAAANSFQAPTHRTSLLLPSEAPMFFYGTPNHSLAISPDGETVVYVGRDRSGGSIDSNLYVRRLNSLETHALPGTQGAKQPFFSPDGQWLGFFNNDGELKKIALSGGNAITLAEGINGSAWGYGVWLENQEILYSQPGPTTVIRRVSAEGGEVTEPMSLNQSLGEVAHLAPVPIPGTDKVLFTSISLIENEPIFHMEAFDIATGERQRIQEGLAFGRYLDSGHMLFLQMPDQVLMVAPFDTGQLVFTGPAVPLTEDIRRDGRSGDGMRPQLAVSRNGVLAYAPPTDSIRQLFLVARDGSSEALDILPDRYVGISVSPDGRYAALEVDTADGSTTRVYDFNRGTITSLSQADVDHSAFWHPDSRSLVVASTVNGTTGLWQKGLNSQERLLVERLQGDPALRNGSWHPDGRRLAITRQTGGEHDIMLLAVAEDEDGDNLMEPLITGSTIDHSPRFSPDGRWLAYLSDRSGSLQVHVRRFPEGEDIIVSTGPLAFEPQWSSTGEELFFIQVPTEGGEIDFWRHVVTVNEAGGSLEISSAQALFPMDSRDSSGRQESYYFAGNQGAAIGLLPDGRFLMARGQNNTFQQEIVLVQNWFAELQAMAPVK